MAGRDTQQDRRTAAEYENPKSSVSPSQFLKSPPQVRTRSTHPESSPRVLTSNASCFYCGLKGHLKRSCRKLKRICRKAQLNTQQQKQAHQNDLLLKNLTNSIQSTLSSFSQKIESHLKSALDLKAEKKQKLTTLMDLKQDQEKKLQDLEQLSRDLKRDLIKKEEDNKVLQKDQKKISNLIQKKEKELHAKNHQFEDLQRKLQQSEQQVECNTVLAHQQMVSAKQELVSAKQELTTAKKDLQQLDHKHKLLQQLQVEKEQHSQKQQQQQIKEQKQLELQQQVKSLRAQSQQLQQQLQKEKTDFLQLDRQHQMLQDQFNEMMASREAIRSTAQEYYEKLQKRQFPRPKQKTKFGPQGRGQI